MNPHRLFIGSAASAAALALVVALIPGGTASAAGAPACTAAHLKAKQTSSGAGMSQPYSMITLTNTGSSSCFVKGYPAITAMSTKSGKKAITITKGGLGNMSDPGVKRIVLAPGGHAWFAVGAATAYDPPVVNFRRVSFVPTPGSGTVTAKLLLPASAPQGKPFPIGVTAFGAGVGPQQ